MRKFLKSGRLWTASLIVLAAVLSGCDGHALPPVHRDELKLVTPTIPHDAAPVYSWHGDSGKLRTFWREQTITVRCRLWMPPDWRKPGDEVWEVEAKNADGREIPFVGPLASQSDENGELRYFLPKQADAQLLPDGMYVALWPRMTIVGGKAASAQPMAMLYQVCRNARLPVRNRVFLIPEQESEFTPKPVIPPPPPDGVPIPSPE